MFLLVHQPLAHRFIAIVSVKRDVKSVGARKTSTICNNQPFILKPPAIIQDASTPVFGVASHAIAQSRKFKLGTKIKCTFHGHDRRDAFHIRLPAVRKDWRDYLAFTDLLMSE
jgi:hypothetical protein